MNYQETVEYIESLSPTLERPTTRRIDLFLRAHGSPQNSVDALHVGGTNGKGSTVAMLDSILRKGKLKVGRFTGPHLLRWNERFHINGRPITDRELAEYATVVRRLSEQFGKENPELGPLTWFEFLTAIAFSFFAEEKVDVAVYEVGLGGRFDATNVIERPLAVGITNVAFDHMHILGDTIAKIASEKAGIIKLNTPVVTAAENEALAVIRARAVELNAPCIHCPLQPASQVNGDNGFGTEVHDVLFEINSNRLPGIYQRSNATVALEMLKSAGFLGDCAGDRKLLTAAVRQGLEDVYWPGRFQVISTLGVILEAAHNPAGAQVLRLTLNELFPEQKIHFVFACYANKDGAAMLESLLRPGDRLYASEADTARSAFPKAGLAKYAQRMGITASTHATIEEAFEEASKTRKESEQVVVTGSFATIKAVVVKLGWKTVEDGLVKI